MGSGNIVDLYTDDINALINNTSDIFEIGKDLKNAEDLENDLMNYILAIEAVDDWAENHELSIFYDLLRVIQQEVIFSNPINDFLTGNHYAIAAYANLLFTPGMTIRQNVIRAQELLQEVLVVDPDFEYALASLAALLVLDNGEGLVRNPLRAFELYSKVLITRPDYPFVLAKLGDLLREGDEGIKKDETLAYHYYQRALDADPKNLHALDALAILYRDGFDSTPANPSKALTYFSKIVEIAPYSFYALTALAELLINEYEGIPQNVKRAYELLQEALSISPNYGRALIYCGELLRVGGDGVDSNRKLAFDMLKRATNADPTCGSAFASLGEIYLYPPEGMEVDEENAYKCFTTAYDLGHKHPFCLNHLAEILLYRNDYDRACELAYASLENDPTQAFAYWILGCACNYKDDMASNALSVSYFEKALECEPDHYPTLYYHGCLLAKSDLWTVKQRAHELLSRALEINPQNHIILYELAKLYYFDKKRQEVLKAMECLRQAIHVTKDYPSSYSFLGYIIINQEMEEYYEEARSHFEQALEIDSNDSVSRSYLCRMYIYGTKEVAINHERARMLIDEFLSKEPHDPEFLELQNLLLEQMIGAKQTVVARLSGFFKRVVASLKG
ncbi:MAG: hypothetical protein LLF94_09140 [Chlamydiales bacterium]|nr:hypothetical protein [Chlamydiales bacterium]